MSIGKKIRSLRKEKKMTQKDLAKKVNVSSQVISNWERQYTTPSADDITRLANALNVNTELILNKQNNTLPELTAKDERDIAKDLEDIINNISTDGYAHFDGKSIDELDEEDKDLLITSLENSMKLAKRLAKDKFTPKKYKK